MDNYEEILAELREEYNKCNELFDIAYGLNGNENTRTAFTQKVATCIPDVMQTIGFLIGEFQREIVQEQISEEAYELDEEYDTDVYDCVVNCSTCKNNVEFPPPHTCDVCTSLDQEEECGMLEAKESDLDIEKYKVYEINSKCSYIGTSLVAAKSAEEANEFIESYREIDKDNKCDSWGYSDVSEEDVIENLWSEESGIINHGISYYG